MQKTKLLDSSSDHYLPTVIQTMPAIVYKHKKISLRPYRSVVGAPKYVNTLLEELYANHRKQKKRLPILLITKMVSVS